MTNDQNWVGTWGDVNALRPFSASAANWILSPAVFIPLGLLR